MQVFYLVLVQVHVPVLFGPTLLRFGLGTYLVRIRSMYSICSVAFISYKSHFISATNKKVINVTGSMESIFYAIERYPVLVQ